MKWVPPALLLIAFYCTMPGLGCLQVVLRSLGLWETQSSDLFDSLEYGGGAPWLIIVSLATWHVAFGAWSITRSSRKVFQSLLTASPLALGKVLDLLFEGRLWTGSYWAIISAVLLAYFTFLNMTDTKVSEGISCLP